MWRRFIASKHPYPFEWLFKEFRGTHWNLWKEISKESTFFCSLGLLACCVVGERKGIYFWGDHFVEERPFCTLFPHLYNLSTSRIILCGLGVLVPFGLCHSLSGMEAMDLVFSCFTPRSPL